MAVDETGRGAVPAPDSEEVARFLAEASTALAGSLDFKVTLARVAELAVPFLADWCAIDVVDSEPGEPLRFARIAVAHAEPGKAELAREMQQRYPPGPETSPGYPKVLRTGEPDFFMSVPLSARGRNLGTMTFVIARSGRTFTARDLASAVDLGRRAGLALDNARLFHDLETAGRRASLLAEASRVLAGSLDTAATLPLVAGLLVPELGDRCTIEIADDDGALRRIEEGGAAEANAEAEVAGMDVPIRTKGELLGTMSFRTSRPGFLYRAADSALAEDLASRVALAVVNARLYAHARDSVRAREEFLSVASHELRTPLTALMLVVKMLRTLPTENAREKMASKLEIAERQVEKIAHTITRLFDVSRVVTSGAGRPLGLDLEEMDLLATVRTVLARFEEDLVKSRCAATVAGSPVVGRWDKFRIEQIVTNLLSNAIKFGGGKPIEITVNEEGGSAVLAITDHGIGIAPEDRGLIFGRYARGSQSRAFDGLGLGLHIVGRVLESLGGSIDVRSVLGEGATFVVTLPLGEKSSPFR